MKKVKWMLVLGILFYSYSFGEEIPNVIISDNPQKEVSTIKTLKMRDKAVMNINIKKISSNEIVPYLNQERRTVIFPIKDLNEDDDFYLTSNTKVLNRGTKCLREGLGNYELEKIDILNKRVEFKYEELKDILYLVRFDKNSRELKKIYKAKSENMGKIVAESGDIVVTFTENYKPFDIVNFAILNGKENEKGKIELSSGKMLSINSKIVDEIIVKDSENVIVGDIKLLNGSGRLNLDKTREGITLKNGSSLLKLGIGFENGELLLQEKGSTDCSKDYKMRLEIKNIDGSYSEYNITVKPVKYKLKLLKENLNFNFERELKKEENNEKNSSEMKKIVEATTCAKEYLQIESKGLDIQVKFKNNGEVRLKNGDNSFKVKLESKLLGEKNENIRTVEVLGKVNKSELLNIPDGDYVGETELEIEIDS